MLCCSVSLNGSGWQVPKAANAGSAISASSLVGHIKYLFFPDQAPSSDFEHGLVEWFILVEPIPVCGPDHVSVLVLLSLPALTVPKLSVAFIARAKGVGARLDNQLC